MTKQVNLLKPNMLPGFGPVQVPMFLLIILVAIILGCGWAYWTWSIRQSLLAEEQSWINTLNQRTEALNRFKVQFPNVNNEAALRIEHETLQTELRLVRETYTGLANQLENAIDGFHTPLLQLNDYDLQGLWLDKISLKDGQRYFLLEGYSRDPSLIPIYLDQLGQSTFGGISIKTLNMSKQDETNLWQFTLSNQRTEAAENQQ